TLALDIASTGQYVRHVLLGNATNPFRVDRMVQLAATFLGLNAAAGALGIAALWTRRREPGFGLTAVYALLAVATVLSIGNVSGDVNYFLEPTVGLALLAPRAATRMWRPAFAALLCIQFAL